MSKQQNNSWKIQSKQRLMSSFETNQIWNTSVQRQVNVTANVLDVKTWPCDTDPALGWINRRRFCAVDFKGRGGHKQNWKICMHRQGLVIPLKWEDLLLTFGKWAPRHNRGCSYQETHGMLDFVSVSLQGKWAFMSDVEVHASLKTHVCSKHDLGLCTTLKATGLLSCL